MDKELVRQLKRSYARCFIGEKNLIDAFYDTFLRSHPDIPKYFEKTDFKQQKLLLRQGINCMLMFAEGNFAGDFCLEEIKVSHNRKHYNIHPEMYPYWKHSLMQVLSEYDPEFNEELARLWSEALDSGIKFMVDGY
jgi:hemoglobin-like flavoprotein